jgi:NADPH:quinone reductase-like Zn-dependent oxidoreductase
LRLGEAGRPAIGDGEVRVRVQAEGLDRGVWHLMAGLPYPVRLAGYGIRAPKTRVRGREVAGRVEAAGSAVTTLAVGDEVFGIGEGSFAEYACPPGRTSSAAKADLVRSIRADRVIDYTRDDIGTRRYDVIIDTGGHRPLRQLRRALTERGMLVIVGSETGGRWLGGSDRQLRALMLSPFTGQKLGTLICSENAADLLVLTKLIESGQVTPVIDRTYPLSDTVAAIRYLQGGHARGKVVISI